MKLALGILWLLGWCLVNSNAESFLNLMAGACLSSLFRST